MAAQTGGYLTQLSMNEQVFARMDRHVSEAGKDPIAGKLLAAAEGFHGTLADKKRASVWASPYASYGKVPLKNGPKVTNTLYGAAAGIDSALQDIGRDWSGVLGFYMAYNGSRQRFEGISTEQNGAGLGVSGLVYKNNFFAGLLVGGSMSDVISKAGYGREHSSLLTAGTAAKTGYVWELGSRGQWALQPELIAAYTWVGGPDYTNKSQVRIKANSLQAVTLQPQLRLSGDLQKWGQPYAEVAWVGSLGDKTKFRANSVELPQFSVKPFMKYGIGIRETWAERWNGYVQAYFTSGGVRSVGAQLGVSYAL